MPYHITDVVVISKWNSKLTQQHVMAAACSPSVLRMLVRSWAQTPAYCRSGNTFYLGELLLHSFVPFIRLDCCGFSKTRYASIHKQAACLNTRTLRVSWYSYLAEYGGTFILWPAILDVWVMLLALKVTLPHLCWIPTDMFLQGNVGVQ